MASRKKSRPSPRARELAARRRLAARKSKAKAPGRKDRPRLTPEAIARQRAVAEGRREPEIPFHPLANAFPLIQGDEFAELVADVKARGVEQAGWLYQGKVLDGRNRYRAAREAGRAMRWMDYKGDDPVGLVISHNLRRRHLSTSARALAAAELESYRHGGKRKGEAAGLTRKDLAKRLHVSTGSVASAAVVRDKGSAKLKEAVRQGDVTVSIAADVAAHLPKGDQDKIATLGEKEILAASKKIRAQKSETRRAERVGHIAELSKSNKALKLDERKPVWLIDFPWKYEFPKMGDTDRSIENHYETWPLTKIVKFCASKIKPQSTPHAVYFIWVPACLTFHVIPSVLKALGAQFKSEIIWDKVRPITGKWTRGRHEKLLICTRGKMPLPPTSAVPESLFAKERSGVHSEKPHAIVCPMIEAMYPSLPRIELFAGGQARIGWDQWGNEAGKARGQK